MIRNKNRAAGLDQTVKIFITSVVVLFLGVSGFFFGRYIKIGTVVARPNIVTAVQDSDGSAGAIPEADNRSRTAERADLGEPYFNLKSRTQNPSLDVKEDYVHWMLAHTPEEEKYISWRWDLAQELQDWGMITNERMLLSFLRTPRENFCREWNLHKAYLDIYMRIGFGVTITDPSVVCRMTETIQPAFDQKVLEIGTGSGYQAAILSQLSNYVFSIEIIEGLARETDELYKKLEVHYPEYRNIVRKNDDGYYGWEAYAPFDRIIVTCSIDHIPPILIKQLAEDGIMIIPVGPPGTQTLLKITKRINEDGDLVLEREDVWGSPVTFVPFTKKSGGKYTLEEKSTTTGKTGGLVEE